MSKDIRRRIIRLEQADNEKAARAGPLFFQLMTGEMR
jgi:hypothetical protein